MFTIPALTRAPASRALYPLPELPEGEGLLNPVKALLICWVSKGACYTSANFSTKHRMATDSYSHLRRRNEFAPVERRPAEERSLGSDVEDIPL